MFVNFKCNREISFEELKEVVSFMENQETTDRYANTELTIDGNDACIKIKVDENGNVTLL